MVERAKTFLAQLATMSEKEVSRYFIGAGSTREAYSFEEDYIIKIPRFVVRFDIEGLVEHRPEQRLRIIQKGVKQTKVEINVFNRCGDRFKYLLNPILAHGRFLNMPFVVMPKIKIASKVVPFDVGNIKEFLHWTDLCVPRSFHNDLCSLSNKYNLYLSDLHENMDNFGIDGSNRLLITDYGTRSDV